MNGSSKLFPDDSPLSEIEFQKTKDEAIRRIQESKSFLVINEDQDGNGHLLSGVKPDPQYLFKYSEAFEEWKKAIGIQIIKIVRGDYEKG